MNIEGKSRTASSSVVSWHAQRKHHSPTTRIPELLECASGCRPRQEWSESTHWVGANSQRLPKVISITYSNEWVPLARFETPRSTLVRSGFKWLHAVATSTGDTVTRIPKRGDLPCSRHIGMGSVGTHICCSQRGSQSEEHGVTHRRVSWSIIHTESALEDGRFVRRSY